MSKIAVIGRPTLADIPLFIQNQISSGLTEISTSGEATPSIATSFRIEDDGKRYIFSLRDDVFWHDGKPFTSEDINYNFSDVEVKINSPLEIAFELKEPFSPFPTIVSQPLFRQKKIGILKNKIELIGVGPFKVVDLVRNGPNIKQLTLKSYKEKIIYRFYNTQETAILAFKLGEVDKILELSSPAELATWPNTVVEEFVHPNRYVALFFNYQDQYLSSKGFRQSLAYAISDKPKYVLRALSPINPNSWAYNPQVKPYDYDPDAAKKLLQVEREERQDFSPKIELTTTIPHLSTAENISQDWNKIGIETSIKVSSYIPENTQVLLIAQEIPPDPDQYSFWHSTQPTNLTKYDEAKVDKLLEDGRQTLDKNERKLIYQDFQRFLVEDSPAVFLFHHQTYTISRS